MDYYRTYEDDEEQEYTILIVAATGSANAARGLVGRAIKKALKVKKWNEGKHEVSYLPANYDYPGFEARFLLKATSEEMENLSALLVQMAEEEGWTSIPAEIY